MIKKIMMIVSICALVCGGVYYFLYNSNIKENKELTTKVNPTVESEVQENIEEEKEKQIDYASISQKLDQYLVGKQFNGTVLVTDKEHVILNKGYGYADVQNKIENTPHTKYRIGSITKTVVATSILQLQDQGKLNIQDNVNKYIPSFPENKNITLYHLLTHTSGLPEHAKGNVNAASRLQLINWIGRQNLEFPAGTGWRYTDYNYMVLAYIIEHISKKPLGDYIKENIFTKADMYESGMGNMVPGDKNFTKGYVKKNQELVPAQKVGIDWLYGCGEMYTTVGDMKKLDEAIINGKLLSEQSIQAMFSPSPERKYAFSFYIYPDYFHNHGVLSGWNTFNNFNKEKGTFVILFSNVKNSMDDDFNKDFRKMVSDLLEQRG
ncbi:serine hydrolase domain-containing protein [Bacillus paranthracis]|uniref:serine hydrolase domain-containing protein n=1 Tax=Bacillus cereus group TaxID=86661 RepID=UPI0009D365C1|nr:serine hydrolase domain-containing protein [Bacillus paranthracis]ONG65974.1 penicillin-binding protein [Bacillus cereus]MCD1181599.1 beta-lactamase family protein [Bacillus paranthracis]MCX3318810.1 serine hydrolase [Bacillus paranthracis]MDR0168712.1 serine hydrolase domain-containing protein [Bacillus paranthracis]ONG77336.1 penicillin-binding protein [Bacillus cereus]